MKKHSSHWVYLTLPILFWAATPVLIKALTVHLLPVHIFLFSSLIASAVLYLILISQGSLHLLSKVKPAQFAWLIMAGLLLALHYILLYTALRALPAQQAFTLNYLWPFFTIIMAVLFLGERLTAVKIIGILISFIGMLVVVSRGNYSYFFAIHNDWSLLYAPFGALCYAFFMIIGKKLPHNKFVTTLYAYLFGAFFSFIYIIFTHQPPTLSWAIVTPLLWLGIFPYALAISLWLTGLAKQKVHKAVHYIFFTPFISLLYVHHFSSEPIYPSSILGLCIILIGVLVQD